MEGQHDNTQNNESHNGHVNFYFPIGQGCGQGCRHGHYNNNSLCLPNLFPTLYIKQAPTNAPLDSLSTVSNTESSTFGNNQTCVLEN